MPSVAAATATALGFEIGSMETLEREVECVVHPSQPLFPRRESEVKEQAAVKAKPAAPDDPFSKLEIRVGRIDEARDHPDADQLLVLTVDLGEDEKRTICAGLRAHLSAAELIGRKVAVLANLKPAVLRGVPSAGMVLASDRADGAVVPVDPGEAEVGDLITVDGIETVPKKKLSKSNFEKAPLAAKGGVVVYRRQAAAKWVR